MTPRVRLKVCGLTRVEDALLAARLGADFLGLVFYPPSPRAITPEDATRLVHSVRAVFGGLEHGGPAWVGVFVNASPDEVRQVMAQVGLDLAQLHGDEPVDALAALRGRAFKALRPRAVSEALLAQAAAYAQAGPSDPALPQLLVDAFVEGAYGGTGQPAYTPAAVALATRFRMLLAGGLTPANVARAVAQVRPWGVDVSSGVERSPGRKDPERLRALTAALGLRPRSAPPSPTQEA